MVEDSHLASGSGTLSQKGQITVPKDVRDALGLHPGDRLLFDVEAGDRAVVRKAGPARLTEILAGWEALSEPAVESQRRVPGEWGKREFRRSGRRR